ncbi:MAG: hypothetical protein HY540_00465 [Deltaproteobacteria bacterium]|nr:hypothetical protein [Deltaproteobacteria bacterium]
MKSNAFTSAERTLIQKLNTPRKVQEYINALDYNLEQSGETIRSFRKVFRDKTCHCLEAVHFAATILHEHGYPSLVLDLSSIDNLDHCLYLYRDGDNYGTIGISREKELYGKPSKFPTVHKLVMSYFDDYVSDTGCIDAYAVANLDDIPRANWRFSERNVWQVQNYLIDLRHHRIDIPKQKVERLRKKYIETVTANARDIATS